MAEQWKRTHLTGFESGFGFFVGDEVTQGKKVGVVAFIYRDSQAISVHWNVNSDHEVAIFHPADSIKLKKTGKRIDTTAFTKSLLKQIYDSYALPDKVVFLYHYNGGGKEAAEKISAKFNLPFSDIKKYLLTAKRAGYL